MTVNVDTNVDENLNKIEKMLEELKLLEDKSKVIRFITIRRVCKD